MAEYVVNNKDNEDLKQVKTGLATEMRGVPIMYQHYPGNVSDIDTVKNIATDIARFGGGDVLFVTGQHQVREYHGASYISEIDKRQREMYGAFGIPVPKEAIRGELIFDAF